MAEVDNKHPVAQAALGGGSGDASFKEDTHWEGRFQLRAMTGTFFIMIVWVLIWAYLFFIFAPGEVMPQFDDDGNIPVKKQTITSKKGVKVEMQVQDLPFFFWFCYALDKEKMQRNDAGELVPLVEPEVDANTAADTNNDVAANTNAAAANLPDYFSISKARLKKDGETKQVVRNPETNRVQLTPSYINLYTWLVIAGLPFLVVVWRAFYKKMTLSYTLTDHRLIVREGLFSRREKQLRLLYVDDLSVQRSIFNRIFGVGYIYVHAPNDKDTPELTVEGITDPIRVKEQIYKIAEEKRSTREFIGAGVGGR